MIVPPSPKKNMIGQSQQNYRATFSPTACGAHVFNQLLNIEKNIITGDFNSHHRTWYSPNNDRKGIAINNIIDDSTHTIMNDNKQPDVPCQLTANDSNPTHHLSPLPFTNIHTHTRY